jgi:GT2 family glycosyltransferase
MEKQVQKLETDVSIVIVNYYSTELLKDCLDSIYNFTKGIDFEIIVVDNGSVAGELENLIKGFPRIKLIKNDSNKGFGTANNQGVEAASGKYVLLLNNDTILSENSIKKVSDFAESLGGENIIGCKLLNEDKSVQKSVYDFPSFLNVFTSNFFLYLLFPKSKYFNKYYLMNKGLTKSTEVEVITGAFLFIGKRTFENLGGFDERFFFYMEDTDLCYRHKQNNGKVIYFPETSIIHLKGKSAGGESWFKNKHQSISTIKFFQKYFFGLEFLLMLIFHYIGLLIRIPLFTLGGIFKLNRDLLMRGFYYCRLLFLYPGNQFKS